MTKLDKSQVKYLMELCRISCNESEQEQLLKDLGNILSHMEQLNELDTKTVAPCRTVLEDLVNVVREDEIEGIMPRELFLANAPSHTGGMIKVPTVIKQN